ncbi:MAG: ion transporter [Verrucomicrobiota bacterium]
MNEEELVEMTTREGVAPWRHALAKRVESRGFQLFITILILVNALVLGLETDKGIVAKWGGLLHAVDLACLVIFVLEIGAKMLAYRFYFFRNGWNCFDAIVISFALMPGTGSLSVLRSLRVLRVLRLLTVVPSLKKVVAAFLHSIPGLGGVVAVMAVFFYTAAVLATNLFGEEFPDWFGSIGKSLYSLFQIMTLESWSMGIVRPVMEVHPWAWAFFVPFIMIATFTILNLFIGIIVSTMQELSMLPENEQENPEVMVLLARIETDLAELRKQVGKGKVAEPDEKT